MPKNSPRAEGPTRRIDAALEAVDGALEEYRNANAAFYIDKAERLRGLPDGRGRRRQRRRAVAACRHATRANQGPLQRPTGVRAYRERPLRVGLFGGSFNPPHEGHREASLLALRRLNLHRIWWLVSPGNPLKDARELAPLALRLEAARRVGRHPRIKITAIEAAIGAAYTYQTITYLKRRCPGVHFVWLMGADNFRAFDRWQRWRDIARLVPIAIIDRPGFTLTALHGPAAQALAPYRLDETDGARLAMAAPPAFVFLHGPRWPICSTALRGKPHRGSVEDITKTK